MAALFKAAITICSNYIKRVVIFELKFKTDDEEFPLFQIEVLDVGTFETC